MFQAYIIRCLITNRGYIGITSRPLRKRWAEHLYDARKPKTKNMAISRAIAKYGAENFTIESLCCALSWDDICAVEAALIEQRGTRAPGGYNVAGGGEGSFGVKRSPTSIELSAAKHRGKPCHPNTRRASSLFHKGRKKSSDHREKIAAAKRGVSRSPETKAKIAAYWAARRAAGDFKTDRPYEHR